MDQNSTNGAGADKRNWRERLGVGTRELPKISDSFRAEPPVQAPQAGGAKPAPRAPQPVTKPAPMAPRTSAKAQAAPAAVAPAPAPRLIDNKAQDVLAEKLRAQRAAAEKLAEQRVQAARERAEAKIAAVPPPAAEPKTAAPTKSAQRPVAAPLAPDGVSRPKFSFAEDDAIARKEPRAETPVPPRPALVTPPPMPPPRPVLGGERAQPPFLRPSQQAPAGRQMPPYRPIDPATGYAPPSRYAPPPQRTDAAAYRPPVRRPPAIDPYARHGDSRPYPPDAYDDDPRAGPRLGRQPVPRGRHRPPEPEGEFDDVFEEAPAPSRQRASARDYQNAYRETEGAYEDDNRRSSGPWLLLLALLIAAAIAAGVIWYYNTKMKTGAATAPSATSGETLPVVVAPSEPAKTPPEAPPETQSQAPAAVKKKQIYDRIVGDQEVPGDQVLPTEEIPVQPAASAEPPADDAPAPSQIPTPDAPAAAVPADNGQAAPVTDETAPLPLPPPPGNDQQGSLDKSAMEKIAAAAAQPELGSTAPPPTPAAVTATATDALPLPPPETASDGAALASDTQDGPVKGAPEETTANAEPIAPVKPVKKKETAKAVKKKTAPPPEPDDLGAEPVVLVPPSQPVPPSQGSQTAAIDQAQQQGAAAEPVKKKKTLLDLFSNSDDNAGAAPSPATQPEQTQTASLQPAPAPAPESAPAPAASPAGGGYVVQLSSFGSRAEAETEYGRLSSLYPTVVGGLRQRVAEAKAGGGTRYQLGLGPVKTRADATRVCSALFQAGERDCIVRSQQ
jgi:cell division protein FtsN